MLMHMLVCQHISVIFISLFAWWLPFLRSWITVYSHLFSLEQGRTDEAVECTEGSVILWFETRYPACWFLLGLVEYYNLLSAAMEKILAIRNNFDLRILCLWGFVSCHRTLLNWHTMKITQLIFYAYKEG